MELKQGLGAPLTTMQIKILDDAKLKKHDDEKTKEIMFEQQKELARIRQDDIEEALKRMMIKKPGNRRLKQNLQMIKKQNRQSHRCKALMQEALWLQH